MRTLLPSLLILLLGTCGRAQQSIPLQPDAWETGRYDVQFVDHRGQSAMRIDDGGQDATGGNMVVAKDVEFRNGTIEYDIALAEGARFSSCYFRLADGANHEHVYLRAAFIDDPMNPSAFQYSAVVDGVNYWDLSYEYQTGVAMKPQGEYNHVKLVIRDRQLLAYVNDMERPALYIPILDGETETGGIGFDGKAWIANVTYSPNVSPGLNAGSGVDPLHNDVRYLRNWSVTQPVAFPRERNLTDDEVKNATGFTPLATERFGLLNLSRAFGKSVERRLVFARTTITAQKAGPVALDLGFSDDVWVYLNGKPVHTDRNPYFTPQMKYPRGRLSVDNSRMTLPLRAGENTLTVAVANDFFGWGLVGRLWETAGLRY